MCSDKLSKFIILIIVLFVVSVVFSGCEGIVPSINHTPAISYLMATSDTIEAGHNTIITCYATDPDGDQLTYTWTKTEGTISGSGSIIAWIAPTNAGAYTITCSVSDGKGGEDSKSLSIQVLVLNQTPKPMVSGVEAHAVTYPLYMSKAPNRIIQKSKRENSKKLLQDIKFTTTEEERRGEIDYGIELYWDIYEGASGYKIYRSVNGTNYVVVFEGTDCCCYGSRRCYFFDNNIEESNIYFYYITAYGVNWETMPSEVVFIDTWLPSCSLISPLNNEVINNSNPTFTWSPVGLSDFPYGSIYSGFSDLWVYDLTDKEVVQNILFYDMTTSNATYNQDGQASPLIPGHSYLWNSWCNAQNENHKGIATSMSEDWVFTYVGE